MSVSDIDCTVEDCASPVITPFSNSIVPTGGDPDVMDVSAEWTLVHAVAVLLAHCEEESDPIADGAA